VIPAYRDATRLLTDSSAAAAEFSALGVAERRLAERHGPHVAPMRCFRYLPPFWGSSLPFKSPVAEGRVGATAWVDMFAWSAIERLQTRIKLRPLSAFTLSPVHLEHKSLSDVSFW
jgi:hypothetical protein